MSYIGIIISTHLFDKTHHILLTTRGVQELLVTCKTWRPVLDSGHDLMVISD